MPPLLAPLIQLPIPERWRALCFNLDWLLLRKFTISGDRLIHSDTGCQARKENGPLQVQAMHFGSVPPHADAKTPQSADQGL